MRPLVVLADTVDTEQSVERNIIEPIADIEVVTSQEPDRLHALFARADGILTCRTAITEPMLDTMHRCKVIARSGIGIDNIPLASANALGITVCNVPDYCADEVADHTLALLLSLARKIVPATHKTVSGGWGIEGLRPIYRIAGQTLGLVGFGHIAREVAARARSLKMQIMAHDPYVSPEAARRAGAEMVTLETLLARADVISVHLPLTDATYHLIDRKALAAMKPNTLLINTSRGAVVDVAALTEALTEGRIGGAALDVLEQEPPPRCAMPTSPNLIITPHMAFYSEQANQELREKSATEVVRVLTGQTPRYEVRRA